MKHRSINQKSVRLLLLVLGVISLIFIVLFWGLYQFQLREERSLASQTVNHLLQASLENAMLKRDLSGLNAIVSRLGEQAEIRDVAILNPEGIIRFSSGNKSIGQPFSPPLETLCEGCKDDFKLASESTLFVTHPDGGRVLRSVNPVRNKEACIQCHGPLDENVVNGILIVDYDAEPIFKKARNSVMWLSLAGLIVLISATTAIWRFMNVHVLRPVAHLSDMSRLLSQGNLQARADIQSKDEFEQLGNIFNTMAARLDNSMQQVLENEDYLQALIDAIPDGIRVIDANYNVVRSNTAYREHLGIDKDSQQSKLCYRDSHQKKSPCPPTLMTCPLNEISRNPVPVKTMQHFRRADQSEFDVQVFAAPLKTPGKEKGLMVESIRNLSEDISFSHEQKLSAVGQLATGVAHEIYNPLSSIRMALKSALSKLDKQDPPNSEIADYLRLVDGEIDKCIDVTQRLLRLSSFGGEKKQLVDLNIAVEETLSLLKYEAEQKDINIILNLDPGHPRVYAANQDIRMLILNLTQNAFHSMPQGGVVNITSIGQQESVCLTICDTGVGINPEHKAHIFDPFFSYRADKDTGTGLGLTICQSIVRRYQGRIEVKDNTPSGACFMVYLNCLDCNANQEEEVS